MNQKGFNISSLFMMFIFALVFYIWLMIAMPFMNNTLFPAIESMGVPNSTLIITMFQYIPLIALLLAIYWFVTSNTQQQIPQQGMF